MPAGRRSSRARLSRLTEWRAENRDSWPLGSLALKLAEPEFAQRRSSQNESPADRARRRLASITPSGGTVGESRPSRAGCSVPSASVVRVEVCADDDGGSDCLL